MAPAATTGSFARILAPTSVASATSALRWSTEAASWSRSVSISRRTCSGVRLLVLVAIGFQRLGGQLRLADRLLGNRRRPLLDPIDSDEAEDRGDHEQGERHDQD